MSRLTWDGTAEPKSSGANGNREMLICPVQLTTSTIGNLTRSIHTLAICDDHTENTEHENTGYHADSDLSRDPHPTFAAQRTDPRIATTQAQHPEVSPDRFAQCV